jgi:hypothetical protein
VIQNKRGGKRIKNNGDKLKMGKTRESDDEEKRQVVMEQRERKCEIT